LRDRGRGGKIKKGDSISSKVTQSQFKNFRQKILKKKSIAANERKRNVQYIGSPKLRRKEKTTHTVLLQIHMGEGRKQTTNTPSHIKRTSKKEKKKQLHHMSKKKGGGGKKTLENKGKKVGRASFHFSGKHEQNNK